MVTKKVPLKTAYTRLMYNKSKLKDVKGLISRLQTEEEQSLRITEVGWCPKGGN